MARITGTLHENLCTFVIISHWILLRLVNIQKLVQKVKTHILCALFSRILCRLWDNVERYCIAGHATDDNIIRRMRFACLRIKATDTHSEYVILLAFPLQQWLHESASTLRYTYVACLVVLDSMIKLLVIRNFISNFISIYTNISVT